MKNFVKFDVFFSSGEQTRLTSDVPSLHDQTLSCLEIKIDVDEMDNLTEAGEDKMFQFDSKMISKETNYPAMKVDPSNLSIVKKEKIDTEGKYFFPSIFCQFKGSDLHIGIVQVTAQHLY